MFQTKWEQSNSLQFFFSTDWRNHKKVAFERHRFYFAQDYHFVCPDGDIHHQRYSTDDCSSDFR